MKLRPWVESWSATDGNNIAIAASAIGELMSDGSDRDGGGDTRPVISAQDEDLEDASAAEMVSMFVFFLWTIWKVHRMSGYANSLARI